MDIQVQTEQQETTSPVQIPPSPPQRSARPTPSSTDNRNYITVQADIHNCPANITVPEMEPPRPAPPHQGAPPAKQSVATMTDIRHDWSPTSQPPSEEEQSPPQQLTPAAQTDAHLGASPQPQRERRIFKPTEELEITSCPETPPSGQPGTWQQRETHLLEKSAGESTPIQVPLTVTAQHTPPILEPDEETVRNLLIECGEVHPEPGFQFDPLRPVIRSPEDIMRKPMRHINTLHKLKNWSLSVRHKWLIVGDSNVSRIPPYNIPHLQVDSFPGATFMHIRSILDKVEPDPKVEILILSVGINNRSQKSPEASLSELRRLIAVAETKFRNAAVWVPVINFSRSLPKKEQNHLHVINKFITTHCLFIQDLPRSMFTVEKDGVHWSHATAKRMLQHWAEAAK